MAKSDFFDKNIKSLFTQRVKHYFFDLLYFLNIFVKPIHYIKSKLKYYNDRIVNMGCGSTYINGWINVDGNPLRKKDLWLDVRSKWPFGKESIDGVIAAHIIEHLYDEELSFFFKELRRVVKKGGFVHLEVPSLEILIENYRRDNNGEIFNEICFWHGAHKQVFDFNRLKGFLTNAGFEVKFHSIGEKGSLFLSNEEMEEICLRPEQSLIVEAIKL
jgi:predicted SAM-dependent methyltransferase